MAESKRSKFKSGKRHDSNGTSGILRAFYQETDVA